MNLLFQRSTVQELCVQSFCFVLIIFSIAQGCGVKSVMSYLFIYFDNVAWSSVGYFLFINFDNVAWSSVGYFLFINFDNVAWSNVLIPLLVDVNIL